MLPWSHPTWVRGLKFKVVRGYTPEDIVAPHVGAWIEIPEILKMSPARLSHPTWVRGLKLLIYGTVVNIDRSHPTWVRGLKSCNR